MDNDLTKLLSDLEEKHWQQVHEMRGEIQKLKEEKLELQIQLNRFKGEINQPMNGMV